jgi:ribosome-binding factor A
VPRYTYIYKMKPITKQTVQAMQSLCSELRPEDGIPPHLLKRQQQRDEHSPFQYCKAAHRAIEAGLSSDCGDVRLKSLSVHCVEPLPGGTKLLVIIAAPLTDQAAMRELEQALQKASGLLRSVLAAEIRRKRTPHLTFRVVPEV